MQTLRSNWASALFITHIFFQFLIGGLFSGWILVWGVAQTLSKNLPCDCHLILYLFDNILHNTWPLDTFLAIIFSNFYNLNYEESIPFLMISNVDYFDRCTISVPCIFLYELIKDIIFLFPRPTTWTATSSPMRMQWRLQDWTMPVRSPAIQLELLKADIL